MEKILSTAIEEDLKKIDSIKDRLEEVIRWGLKTRNRNGYFACLYKNITGRVKDAIQKNEFEDGERMVAFVVHFANYYLNALEKYTANSLDPSSPWYQVFEVGKQKRAIVQHMLLGVNTHINFDLPNTCIAIAPGESLLSLCNDFVKINSILSSAIKEVEDQIFSISPLLAITGKLMPKFERQILNFSINVARCKSWECACLQALASAEEQNEIREKSKEATLEIARRILSPGKLANPFIWLVSLLEVKGMKRNLKVLNS
ncbi:MAG TPA: DUF5995 family protein [Cytophagaceae bacterium]